MRVCLAILSVVLMAFITTGCDDSESYNREGIAEDFQDQIEDIESAFESKQEELERQLQKAEERIQDEFEDFDESDVVSREELEKLKIRIRESADRIQEEMRDTDHDFEATMKDLGRALERVGEAIQNDSDIEPIDHRKLRDLLPTEIAGLERYDTDGSTNSVLGIRTSKVVAKYESRNADMSVTIIDLGSISGAAAVGLELLDTRIDREFDKGFQRTTEFDGYPAYLNVEDKGVRTKRAAIIRVTERFVVAIEAEGRDLDDEIIEDVVDRISLRRLARLGRR